ncbi:MAG: hypothetical protein RIC16_13345 [Rhodospirillales bacterium]
MDPRDQSDAASLPAIPLIECGQAGPAGLAAAAPERLREIVRHGARKYRHGMLAIGDQLSEYWLVRNDNPYLEDLYAVAGTTYGLTGIFMLNLSYEWSCATAMGADPEGDGNRMLRTLDWPLDGLGRDVVVARFEGEEGTYDAVTWPGFVGVATAMAPGRFSAAINQPPMRKWTPSCWFDWAVNRIRLWREDALPPVHLLRQVFEQCRDYAEAKEILSGTPLAMPAFFSLSGLDPDECCLIERTEDEASVIDGPRAVANHWQYLSVPGRYRGHDSLGRLENMNRQYRTAPGDFGWVQPPILNSTTRLAVVANATLGVLKVMGLERTLDDVFPGAEQATRVYETKTPHRAAAE